jgi:ABC-type taurine transport system ATPase subunit
VFQFPVIYDTMTVAENLAFPLRNRGVQADRIKQRVGQIAEMLDMSTSSTSARPAWRPTPSRRYRWAAGWCVRMWRRCCSTSR